MPIYEYRCKKCGEVIEKIQKFSDPPLKKHPGCGGSLTKLISQSSFQLKGSGWYVTDYAGKGKPESGDKGDKPDSDDKGDKPDSDDKKESKSKSEGDSKSGSKSKDSKKKSTGKSDSGGKK
jgi:putative FmdB family regulatory protein